jgi:hypothetical protein
LTGNIFFDNPEDIISSLQRSDVISVFFPYIKKTILIDKRTSHNEDPIILLTDMVRTPRERVQSLQNLRPNFPIIENILLIPWTRYISTLKDSGVWDAICDLIECPTNKMAPTTSNIFNQLLKLEKKSLAEVIKGSSFTSLWTKT